MVPDLGGLHAIVEEACCVLWHLNTWANLMGHEYRLLFIKVDEAGTVHFGFVGLDELDVQLRADSACALIAVQEIETTKTLPQPRWTRPFWTSLYTALCAAWVGDLHDEKALWASLAEAKRVHLLDLGIKDESELHLLDATAESMLKTRDICYTDESPSLATMLLHQNGARIPRELSRVTFSHHHLFPEFPNDDEEEDTMEVECVGRGARWLD